MSKPWVIQRVNHKVKNFNDVEKALATINKNFEAAATKEGAAAVAGGVSISGVTVVFSASAPALPKPYALLWINTTDTSNPVAKMAAAGSATWNVTFGTVGS